MKIGSVPHKLLKMAMEHFWFPEAVQDLLMSYYDNFVMRFSTGKFTTESQRLEVGIAAGCTTSVVLFVLVMEMILRKILLRLFPPQELPVTSVRNSRNLPTCTQMRPRITAPCLFCSENINK